MQLSAYMENLNQHVQLYMAMKRLWSDERLVASLTSEQHRVAYTFVREMEQHGISQPHVPPSLRCERLQWRPRSAHLCHTSLRVCLRFDRAALTSDKREQAAVLQGEILRLMTDFTTNVNQQRPRTSISLTQLLDTVPPTLHTRLKPTDGRDAMVDADVSTTTNTLTQY